VKFDDMLTVMWKSWKELFRIKGRKGQTALMLITPLMLAVVMPLQEGEGWMSSGFSLLIAVIIPLLLVGTSIPAAFASEREQHTLPTLLASRLSDRAILFGKVATSVAFGWGATLVALLIGLVSANISAWNGQVLFYEPSILIANVSISFLFALLTAGAGVLFSLRAESVQQAQQSLMAVMLIPLMLLQAVFMVAGALPPIRDRLRAFLETTSLEQVVLIIGVVLAVLGLVCITLAIRKFNRAQLILG
jgi:ABC-2 type transport system permease protein